MAVDVWGLPVSTEAAVAFSRILKDGFVAGMVGAAGVAVWFLIVDTILAEPFFTPAMLGSAVFRGLRDPTVVEIAFPTVAGYTVIHLVTFLVVGTIAAALASMVEKFPSTLFLVVVMFAIFEFGFYLVVAVLARTLLGALAWWAVAAGNLLAAIGMGYFFWQVRPRIREALTRHPMGTVADDV